MNMSGELSVFQRDTSHSPSPEEQGQEEEDEDWAIGLAFSSERHTDRIEGLEECAQNWRLKDRMKTVSVALILCLNVGVDPPDVVKTQPCARLECWIDPLAMSPQKALEAIGVNLQKQYERWQPRARYKQTLDPTADEIKKVTSTLRRNAKDERVLFHYNGHGVPKPTANGEIWVFNRSYTQYIPLSIYDLQTWMWSPSIYVFDCSNAGMIVDAFQQFADQHQREYEQLMAQSRNTLPSQMTPPPNFKQCIQLAACATNQILPMNAELPADLFTACLTTPIKIALRWFVLQNTSRLVPRMTLESVDKIPGQLNDRRTMLGELNWIFTAITDTIAWNSLPRDVFQRLFRQDLLVASLFRNFLLAERILKSYDCTPVSWPKLPPTSQHPMWSAWDLALDICLSQLPGILEGKETFQNSPFFEEQLTAFQVWLSHGSQKRSPPEQLPIVLQVLLSQVHRLRALELLGRFLDLGPWAVNLALSVGIFPYVLKLLQSSARELRPLLLFIWTKILAVDVTCQADLVRDGGHKYFLSVLQDTSVPDDQRTLAAFVVSRVVWNHPVGQEAVAQVAFISNTLEMVYEKDRLLRQWLVIGIGLAWHNAIAARWSAIRDSAHEKLFPLLRDPIPEVRAATAYALGTFIRSGGKTERNELANKIDQAVALQLLNVVNSEASPLVRKEIVSALQWIVLIFESTFIQMAIQQLEEEKIKDSNLLSPNVEVALTSSGSLQRPSRRSRAASSNITNLGTSPELSESGFFHSMNSVNPDHIRRAVSISSLSSLTSSTLPSLAFNTIYVKMWHGLSNMEKDPYFEVSNMAKKLTDYVRNKAKELLAARDTDLGRAYTYSNSSNDSMDKTIYIGDSPPPASVQRTTPSFSRIRKRSIPSTIVEEGETSKELKDPLVVTGFIEWCAKHFAEPAASNEDIQLNSKPNHEKELSIEFEICGRTRERDTEMYYTREWRYARNATVRREAKEECQRPTKAKMKEVFCNRNPLVPSVIRFHPYDPWLAVADKDGCTVWDWERSVRLVHFNNQQQPRAARITSMEFVNGHDDALLLIGADDGSCRIWRDFIRTGSRLSSGTVEDSSAVSLVSAWNCIAEMTPSTRCSGLVLDWNQDSLQLLATGDVRLIRIWDVERELKVSDFPTGSENCVTSIHHSPRDRSLFVAACGDGSVRLFDKRCNAQKSRVMTWREHTAWVIDCEWISTDGATNLVSGSLAGDIRFMDPRHPTSVHTVVTAPNSQGMTAMAVHPKANLFACGIVGQHISVHDQEGEVCSTIAYHDGGGILGSKIAAVSCLTFHPHRVCLAAGGMDSMISVFSSDKSKK
uniref:Regulatory-associated protein of mTOR n=1 Tax=Daphnia magna TaxID=35525 RepID=A0A0P5SHU1_9CRUS